VARAIDLALARRQRDEQDQASRKREQQFLDQAKGDPGPAGPQGRPGEKGGQGEKGDKPDHQWRGTELRFEKPDGAWGKWVDLQGPRGKRGGGGGAPGTSFDPAAIPVLPDLLLETDYFLIERGGQAYRVSLETLRELIGAPWQPPEAINGGGAAVVHSYSVDGGTLTDPQDRTITGGPA
jgi:hypothetical protein